MFRLSAALSALIIVLMFFSGCSTPGTRVGRAAARVEDKRPVHAYRLANGFSVLVHETGNDGPVAVQLWVEDGSAHEPPGKPGIAHFVEHMLFEGSSVLPAGGAGEIIEGMGGRITGNTGKDFSYVGVALPDPEGWDRAVEIIYGMTTTPDFSPEKIDDQRKVIGMEIEYDATYPERVLMDNLLGKAFRDHPYGNPITGTTESIKGFTPGDAAAYHKSVYIPSNMSLVVAGNVDPAEAKAIADKTFGTMERREPQKPLEVPEHSQISVRESRVSMPVRLTYMAMGWHICPTSDRDVFALEVLRNVVGQGNGSRLVMELRERKALVLDTDAQLFPYRNRGMFVVNATLNDRDDLRRTREEILRQVQKLKTELVSGEELRRAVLAIERQQMLATDTVEGKAYALGYWAAVYGGRDFGEYMENVRSVKPEDVRRVAQKYLGEGNYTLSVITPAAGR